MRVCHAKTRQKVLAVLCLLQIDHATDSISRHFDSQKVVELSKVLDFKLSFDDGLDLHDIAKLRTDYKHIINVDSDDQKNSIVCCILNVDARVCLGLLEALALKESINHQVPLSWCLLQTIETLLQSTH